MNTQNRADGKITMICPNLACRRTLAAPLSARGRVMRCVHCRQPFRVPEAAGPESVPVPAPEQPAKRPR